MARLAVGDIFPDFQAPTQFDDAARISKIADRSPLMLVVLRYIGCPSCRYDVHMIQENIEKFNERGVRVAVVMQSTPESVREALADEPLDFPILCDPEYAIYNALEIGAAASVEELLGSGAARERFMRKREGIAALGYAHGKYEGIEEQLPAFFYLDPDRRVLAAHYAGSLGDMPTVGEMLAM